MTAIATSLIERYNPLIDDIAGFEQSAQTPLPPCLWVNALKTTPADLVTALQTDPQFLAPSLSSTSGAQPGANLTPILEPIAWYPDAFRWRSPQSQATATPSTPTKSPFKPGLTLPFVAGWYYVQEEIAMTAVATLDPQPGDSVLDLCAAPGGKTAQIALRVGSTGYVIANEANRSRLPSLTATINRLGLLNVALTYQDGRSANFPPQSFDRVLVDAPCSGEGGLRDRPQRPTQWRPDPSQRLARLQRQLLDHALELVKPGGVLIYSTCTFAPEENEAVLDAVVGDRAEFESAEIPGLTGQPGITHWQGQTYRADLIQTRRYWPHLNNTGGFFVAKLRRRDRRGGTSGATTTPTQSASEATITAPARANPTGLDELAQTRLQPWCDRFGLSSTALENCALWQPNPNTLWLSQGITITDPIFTTVSASRHSSQPDLQAVSPQNLGIPVVRRASKWDKPTTAFLQRFGAQCTRNIVALDEAHQAIAFLQGQTQPCVDPPATPGYVHVRYGEFELGCGLYRHDQLISQLPKLLRLPC